MFQPSESGFGGGAIALPFDGVAPHQTRITRPSRAREWLGDLDLVVDLGAELGSRRWWRGLVTCIGLCVATWQLAPGIAPLTEPARAAYTQAQAKEARVLGVTPLAYGADTGSRMAPTRAVEPLADTPERPQIDLTATLGQGDGFARVLTRAGVSESEARRVADLVSGAVPLRSIAPGTRIELTLGHRAAHDAPRPLEHLLFRARLDLKLEVRLDGDRFRLSRIPIAIDDTPLRLQGSAGADLIRTIRDDGVPSEAAEAFLKAVAGQIPPRSIGAGDRFDLIVEHRRAATGEVEYGDLLYAGLTHGSKRVRMLRWESNGRAEWYDASGVGERKGLMTKPVLGYLTSSFGMRRHPILGFSRFHKGVDFGAPYGSPIVAATEGVVTFSGRHGGHGNYVMLDHGGGLATAYGHMSRIVARRGARVQQGELIGYVGSTGLSTGPHLHYEVWRNGVAINPNSIKFTGTAQLFGRELARFRKRLAELMGISLGSTTKTEPEASAEPKRAEHHRSRRHHRRR